jgi:hypothetical protein
MDQRKMRRMMAIMEMMDEMEDDYQPWENRLRDEQGRFLPDPEFEPLSEEPSTRLIRIVRQKGTYNSYDVKDGLGFMRMLGAIGVVCIMVLMYFVA